MRLAGVGKWVDRNRSGAYSLDIARTEKKKAYMLKTPHTRKYALSSKAGLPSVLNPPGTLMDAANVTVAMSVATNSLVSCLFKVPCVMAGVSASSFFSGDSKFVNTRVICC